MAGETKKRGAPKRNQNARKHGFYCRKLGTNELDIFKAASGLEGVNDEITALRVQLKWLIDNDPQNVKMIWRGMNALGRLLRTQNSLSKKNTTSIEEAVAKVLGGVPLPPTVERRRDK